MPKAKKSTIIDELEDDPNAVLSVAKHKNQNDAAARLPSDSSLVIFSSAPEIKRDEHGHFAKGQSGNAGNVGTYGTSTGQKVARWFRDFLESVDPDDPNGYSWLVKGALNMAKIMTNDDPKGRKEAVWAWNALHERGYGPAIKDESELEALRQSGNVTIQVISLPALPQTTVPKVKPLLIPAEFEDDPVDE